MAAKQETLTAKQVQEIIQAAQSAQQAAQEAKQIAQDTAQSVQNLKQGVMGSAQEKSSMFESKQEEINTGEAFRHQTFVDGQMWAFDKKQIAASEQSERVRSVDHDRNLKELELKTKEVELARKEHNLAHQQKLDSLQVRSAEQAELFKHAINMEYARFNNAVSEPISPNITGQDDD